MKRLVYVAGYGEATKLYDRTGAWLGYEVKEMEAFTAEELKPVQCPECGRANGTHGDYFIKTGQDGFGSVEGFYQKCRTGAAQ